MCANRAGAIKKGGDPNHPSKLHFLSFMVMELLGPSVGQLSLELQTYKTNLSLLVNHGLGMLKVGQSLLCHTPDRLAAVARLTPNACCALTLTTHAALPALQVLRFMHKNNIIHRDIKPGESPCSAFPHCPARVQLAIETAVYAALKPPK